MFFCNELCFSCLRVRGWITGATIVRAPLHPRCLGSFSQIALLLLSPTLTVTETTSDTHSPPVVSFVFSSLVEKCVKFLYLACQPQKRHSQYPPSTSMSGQLACTLCILYPLMGDIFDRYIAPLYALHAIWQHICWHMCHTLYLKLTYLWLSNFGTVVGSIDSNVFLDVYIHEPLLFEVCELPTIS